MDGGREGERKWDGQAQLGSQDGTVLFQRVRVLCNVKNRACREYFTTPSGPYLCRSLFFFILSSSLLFFHLPLVFVSLTHSHVDPNLYDFPFSVEY